jgi:RecB family exonuclease
MPTAKLVQIESWSYSKVQVYETCPRQAKHKYIDKLPEPGEKSPALQHGTRVHALAAAWVTKKLPDFTAWDGKELLQYKDELERVIKSKKIPEELERFEKEFRVLIKAKAQCEEMWNFDRQWNLMGKAYNPRIWLRVKVDSHFIDAKKIVHIIDYKTGKEKADHAEQRSIYALAAFVYYPDALGCTAQHWYLDAGVMTPGAWDAKALETLKKEWGKKTTALLSDTSFRATPSPSACRWCAFRKDRGGPCGEFV